MDIENWDYMDSQLSKTFAKEMHRFNILDKQNSELSYL